MRILYLVTIDNKIIKINPLALDAFNNKDLQTYITKRLKNDGLIKEILNELSTKTQLTKADCIGVFQKKFPLRDVSAKTWAIQTGNLLKWLKYCEFDKILDIDIRKSLIVERSQRKYFFPQKPINFCLKLINNFEDDFYTNEENVKSISSPNRKVIADFSSLGLIGRTGRGYFLTEIGLKFKKAKESERKKILANILLQWPNIKLFLDIIKKNHSKTAKDLFSLLPKQLGLTIWTEETKNAYYGPFINWLIYTNQVVVLGRGGRGKKPTIVHPSTIRKISVYM